MRSNFWAEYSTLVFIGQKKMHDIGAIPTKEKSCASKVVLPLHLYTQENHFTVKMISFSILFTALIDGCSTHKIGDFLTKNI